ncbi:MULTISPECIES: PH domain-containing protein [unclassified Gordonia (in: high G+C Gram-positive bacteria)]|uniref:PH domain-containing protein n=1 Tax=unclassified Gordonia (in: high G+C Gram-positive bacteria) TaxID=2657482 RepID=UPI001F10CD21|nr:PH domain-containing protein [Gordonia sp. ABSL49_1]MCH5643509.1 PH domain-containing protein [Gordonia sp. ABSL49_1]
MPRFAIAAAVVVLAIHITFGILLTISDTGPRNIGTADQAAIILIGILICGAILLLTRPRLRVGRAGIGVRNLVGERLFGWDDVVGLTYPERGFGAQLELPADEHIPVLAVQAGDGDRAVEAMNRYRELEERYGNVQRSR